MYQTPRASILRLLLLVHENRRHARTANRPPPTARNTSPWPSTSRGNRWGNGKGIYDYHAEADRLLDNMKNRQRSSTGTNQPWRARPAVPEFNPEHKMVRFTPNQRRADHTDPSYHLPAFYELWARWGPDSRPAVLGRSRQSEPRLSSTKSTNPVTGLGSRTTPTSTAPPSAAPAHESRNFGRRCLAHRRQLVRRLVLVGRRPARAGAQRPHPGLLRVQGHRHIRQPLPLDGNRSATPTPPPWSPPTPSPASPPPTGRAPRNSWRPSGSRNPVGPAALLRWHVVPDGLAALQRRVPHLGPEIDIRAA